MSTDSIMLRKLILFYICFGWTSAQCDHPGCFCIDNVLSCADLSTFPPIIQSTIKSVVIYGVDIYSLPSDLSTKLPRLTSFQVYNGKIGWISSGAFANLKDVLEISFFSVEIGIIESKAFNNIRNVSSISFYSGSIKEFQENSVANITGLKSFSISFCNITVVRQRALNEISGIGNFQIFNNYIGLMEKQSLYNLGKIGNFLIHDNSFQNFKCMSIEDLLEAANQSAFYQNGLSKCSCDLQWIVRDKLTLSFLHSNWCKKDGTNTSLDKLDFKEMGCSSESDICSENFGITIASPTAHSTVRVTMATTENINKWSESVTKTETTRTGTTIMQKSVTTRDTTPHSTISSMSSTSMKVISTATITSSTRTMTSLSKTTMSTDIGTRKLQTSLTTMFKPLSTSLPTDTARGNPKVDTTNSSPKVTIHYSLATIVVFVLVYTVK